MEEYACIIKFNIFMPKNSFRHCFAMPHVRAAPSVCFADVSPSYGERPLKGRLGYTLSLCRGDLRSPAGELRSPLPDDTNKVCVLKTAGVTPRPTTKLIILCFLLLFGAILSKSLHLEGKVSTRASLANDAVDG